MLHHQNDKYKNIQGKQKYKCHEKLICSNGELAEKIRCSLQIMYVFIYF